MKNKNHYIFKSSFSYNYSNKKYMYLYYIRFTVLVRVKLLFDYMSFYNKYVDKVDR